MFDEESPLRKLLRQKNERFNQKRIEMLHERREQYKRPSSKAQTNPCLIGVVSGGSWRLTWSGVIPVGTLTSTFTTPKTYTEAEMTEQKDKQKELAKELKASKKEISALKAELSDMLRRLEHSEEELQEFKRVTSFFLSDFTTNLDNIMPDDLEYEVIHYEQNLQTDFINSKDYKTDGFALLMIHRLCKDLGMIPTDGLTAIQDIKIFIKTLAREKVILEKKLGEKDCDGKSDNLGSGGTTNF